MIQTARLYCLFIGFVLIFLNSCVSHQDLLAFQPSESEPMAYTEPITNSIEITIQPEDLLKIDVSTDNELINQQFSTGGQQQGGGMMMGGGQMGQGNNLELFMGYFVDKNGYVDFPKLGKVFLQGKTLEEARAIIAAGVEEYAKNAVINIRFLNFKVTVLGEVNQPGYIRLTNRRITIFDAIGLAGDFSDYANRDEVLLVREENGERQYITLSLKSRDIFKSPYFYLQQNDAIYVEPIRARVATVADPFSRVLSYGSAAISIVTLIIAFTR